VNLQLRLFRSDILSEEGEDAGRCLLTDTLLNVVVVYGKVDEAFEGGVERLFAQIAINGHNKKSLDYVCVAESISVNRGLGVGQYDF